MAQVSHSTSQDHIATAFHFLSVNMLPESFFFAPPPTAVADPDAEPDAPVSIGADSESILKLWEDLEAQIFQVLIFDVFHFHVRE